MEHIKRIKTILENVKLYTNDWKHYIKFDRERLIETILFFFYDQLIDMDYTKIPKVDILIDEPTFHDSGCKGRFTICLDAPIIFISTKSIIRQYKQGLTLKPPMRAFFYNFLHEFYHFSDFLRSFIKQTEVTSLEDFNSNVYSVDRNIQLSKIKEYLPLCDPTEMDLLTTSEIDADRFAYKNTPYLESLYSNHGYTFMKAIWASFPQSEKDRINGKK